MPTVNLTIDNFSYIVSSNCYVIIDFWAEWCGPCKRFSPIFEEASAKYPNVVFAKVDIENEKELADYFEIKSIPMVVGLSSKYIAYQKPGIMNLLQLGQVVDLLKKFEIPEDSEDSEE